MGVFMGIQVGDSNAGRLQFTDLRGGLGFNLISSDAAADRAQSEAAQTLVKAVSNFSRSESCSLSLAKHGQTVHEYDVATHAHLGRRFCALDGVLECQTIGHEGGGGHDP